MSNNIYDILGKLKGLTPKENPVSTASGPIYESVESRGDIIGGIKALNEKYYKAQNQPQPQQQQSDNVRYQSDNPLVKGFLQRAYQEFPNSANDNEAIVALMAKDKQQEDQIDAQANEWMQQAKAKIDTQQDKMNDMAQVIIDQEKRFQDFNKEVAAAKDLSVTDKAKAAGEFAKVAKTGKDKTDVAAKGKQIVDKAKADAKDKKKDKEEYVKLKDEPEIEVEPTAMAKQEPDDSTADTSLDTDKEVDAKDNPISKMVQQLSTVKDKKETPTNDIEDQSTDPAELKRALALAQQSGFDDEQIQQQADLFAEPANDARKQAAAESRLMKEDTPNQASLGFDEIPRLRQELRQTVRDFILNPSQARLQLSYPGGQTLVYPRETILRLAEILKDYDANQKKEFFDNVLPSAERFSAFIQQLRTEGNTYYFYKVQPENIVQAKNIGLGQTRNGSWYSPNFPNPQAEKLFGPGRKWTAPSKQQTQESKNFLGNDNMSNNIYNILGRFNNLWKTESTETVVDLGEPVYESVEAKGDITEAVKSLEAKFETYKKEVSEGKKLKDKKQFDDVAETGDYYLTDKGNKVIKTKTGIKHEKVHAGDDDKDDLDEGVEVEESGLQAYLGKKKYGKEGMKALQQAGREGASKETMAKLRARHDKMDEARPSRADKVTKDLTSIADKKGYKSAKDFTRQDWDKVAKPHGYTGKEIAAVRGHKVEEVAPPGAKAERMVKHIKKGYSKDGKLSKREKGIAYATAWKAHNKGQVEEGTNFGDTIKNSEGKMTKVTVKEGKDAIRNHPIYTTKEAWDHYSQELAEQEMMEQSMMEAPVVDVQQELDEIAKLAGLAPKMEAKSVCPSCKCEKCECNENLDPMVPADSASPLTHTEEGMGCTMEELEEAASRKDFRRVADRIANMKDRDEAAKLGHAFADDFEKANPRFKRKMFLTACGLDEAACNMRPGPATIMVGEEAMDEGNEFTKARLDAIAQGKDTFSVGGKTYNVSGDTSDEKTQVESVNEDININVTANGEEDVVNLIRKLSGMEAIKTVTDKISAMSGEACGACGSSPCGCEEVVDEQRDIEWDNTPEELTAPISAAIPSGTDLNRSKRQDPHTANKAANPLGESQIEKNLWKAYEEIINDVKA